MSCAETAEPIQMPFGIWTWMCPRKYILDGSPDPLAKEQLLGERTCLGMLTTLCWGVNRHFQAKLANCG